MNDLISRQAAIDAIRASTSKYTGFMEMEMYTDDDAVEAIEGLPSAQPEIIHCRDCKWHRFDKDNIPYCYNIDYGYGWKDDDFCSRAERREVSETDG